MFIYKYYIIKFGDSFYSTLNIPISLCMNLILYTKIKKYYKDTINITQEFYVHSGHCTFINKMSFEGWNY